MSARLAFLAVLAAPHVALAEPTVFVDGAVGAAAPRETEPAFVDPSPAVIGHLGVGVRFGRHVSIALASALGRSTYDNSLEPPVEIAPEDRMTLTRWGAGLRAGGHVALGPVEVTLGAGAYVHRARVGADGRHTVVGITGEYAKVDDTSLGFEVSLGASMSPWPCGRVGLRFLYVRHRADLPEETDLGGPAIELFVQADLVRAPTSYGGSTIGCSAGRPR